MDFSKLTPLGRADKLVKKELEGYDNDRLKDYEKVFKRYGRVKSAHLVVKILLYAGIITTVTATFGIETGFIAQIASYVGVSVLLIVYSALTYLDMVYREAFYVRRELLINSAD